MRNLGKPVELARQYYKEGADEVCYLDLVHILMFECIRKQRYTSHDFHVRSNIFVYWID